MALMITDDCTSCAACAEECPQQAIDEGDPVYVIDGERCVECVGWYDEPQCVAACPVECIMPDPARGESREELEAKKARLVRG
jgi:ferredoxin